MPPRTRPATAAQAPSASACQQRPASKVVKMLQAGVSSLGQPYSEKAGADILEHLKPLNPLLLESKKGTPKPSEQRQVLALLNTYFQWFVSGMQADAPKPPAATTTPNSSSSSSSSSSSATGAAGSSRSSRDQSYLACGISAYMGGMFFCCSHIDSILTPASKAARPQAAEALLPPMTTLEAGTLTLLAQAAEGLLSPHTRGFMHMDLCSMVVRLWVVSYIIMDNISDADSSISSMSSISSRKAHLWAQVPAVAQGVPAIAQLLHWYLLQPSNSWSRLAVGNHENLLQSLVAQLHILLEAAAGAAVQLGNDSHSATTSRQRTTAALQGRNKKARVAAAAAGAQPAAVPLAAGVTGVLGDLLVPGAAKDKVERLLWHALATATAAIQAHVDVLTSSSYKSSAGSSSSSSSRGPQYGQSSSSSGSDTPTILTTPTSGRMLPKGVAYDLQLTWVIAISIYHRAAPALLQMSLGTVPQQEMQQLVAASAWLQKNQAACMTKLTLQSGSALRRAMDPKGEHAEAFDALLSVLADMMTDSDGASGSSSSSSSSSKGKAAKRGSKGGAVASATTTATSKSGTSSTSSKAMPSSAVTTPSTTTSSSSSGSSSSSSAPGKASNMVHEKQLEQDKASLLAAMRSKGKATIREELTVIQSVMLAAPGYLCWPGALGSTPNSGSSTTSTTTSSSSSSGSSRGGGGNITSTPATKLATTTNTSITTAAAAAAAEDVGPLGSPAARLQLLAAALSAKWRDTWRICTIPGEECQPHKIGDGLAWAALFQVLLLVVQQLQGAPAQLHSEFLHSPFGGRVLQVMSEMLQEEYSMPMGLGSAAAWGTCQDTPPAQQQQQQQQQQQLDPEDWYMRMINGLTVTEQLLLPGLLLQPVPNTQVCEPGPASCSSSAHHQGSSDAAVPGADTTTTSPTSSTTSSSSSIHKVFCPAPGVLPPAAAAVGGPVAVALDGGLLLPLVLVPHSALKLPPGFTPPPQAYFVVEQLLRGLSLGNTLPLAIQLLQGSVQVITPPTHHHHHQQQQQGLPMGGSGAADQQAASAECLQLAYCSLASSVIQKVQQLSSDPAAVAQVMALAAELTQAAVQQVSRVDVNMDDSSSSSGSGSGDGSSGGGDTRTMQAGTDSSRSGGVGSGRQGGGRWTLAASLAAAAVAGAYKAHMRAARPPGASVSEISCQDTGTAAADVGGTSKGSSSTSSDSGADTSAVSSGVACHSAAARPLTEDGAHASDCGLCRSAMEVCVTLRCLEGGAGSPTISMSPAQMAVLAEAAQQHGTILQGNLQQQLLALAWRHPVPGVCGNVLCRKAEGPAAAGVLRNRAGTMCGGCKAAWYCCEACQRAAWDAHSKVCKGQK